MQQSKVHYAKHLSCVSFITMVDTRFSVSVHIMVSLAYNQDELLSSETLAKVLKTLKLFGTVR